MEDIQKDQIISFRYKGGRKVRGEVLGVQNKLVFILLHTDYIGKNDEWFQGEEKVFNLNEMKKIHKCTPKK